VLNPGLNLIGVQSDGETDWGKYNHGLGDSYTTGWLNFDWLTINYQPLQTLAVEPAVWAGQAGQKKVFTATSPTTLAGVRFVWSVDDIEVQNGPKPTLEYTVPDLAKHLVTVEAWNDVEETPKQLKDATAIVNGPVKTVPPAPGKASIKITSPKNGATLTSNVFDLSVSYSLSKPRGSIAIHLNLLSGGVVVYTIKDTEQVTDQSGTLTIPAGLDKGLADQVNIYVSVEDAEDEVTLNYSPPE
jgi:hypothetical protein